MKQVTLNVPNNKYRFFLELIENLNYIKISGEKELTVDRQEFVTGMKESLHQVEQHLNGEIELKSANQLLNEL